MPSQHSLDSLLDNLGDQEPEFLSRVRSSVLAVNILRTGKACLAIVEKDADDHGSPRTHQVGAEGYTTVLGCFVRKKLYRHHELDSALTEPVAQTIGECYDEFLKDNSEMISQHFVQQIVGNDLILEVIMGEALDRAAKEGMSTIRNKAVHAMVEGVKHVARHAASTQAGHTVSTHVSAEIPAASGTVVAHQLGPVLLNTIAMHSQAILTHVLRSAEFNATIHATAKSCAYVVLRKVFLQVVDSMAQSSGLFRAAGELLIRVPAWNVVVTISTVLANGVEVAMGKDFRAMNRPIVERMASEIFGTEKLTSAVADEISRSSAVEEVLKNLGVNPAEESEGSTGFARSRL
jgi:hypothetical protein